jgi:hypothetical protein
MPKVEELDDDCDMGPAIKSSEPSIPMGSAMSQPVGQASTAVNSTTGRRPRGRPRKHPVPTVSASIQKTTKGRSKTGCITCRRRKKKCDEAKPECEWPAVTCFCSGTARSEPY